MKKVKILSIVNATHDVLKIKTEKPLGISYFPGQAIDVSVDKPNFEEKTKPFTFTSIPSDDHLEFLIKVYPQHKGVTEQIEKLNQGDTLLIGDVFGAIKYKEEGVIIAGGAGITPFIAILKDLEKQNKIGNNKLIFANKTSGDIIEKDFLNHLLGKNFINVLSREEKEGFEYGHITKELIKSQMENPNTYVYLCGPKVMMNAILVQLKELGVEESKIIKERF